MRIPWGMAGREASMIDVRETKGRRRSWLLGLILLWTVAAAAAPNDSVEAALRANNRGVGSMSRSAFGQAEKEFQQAIVLDPKFLEARVNLGIAQYAAGSDQPARATLEEVLKRDSHQIRALYTLGLIDKNHGDYAAALAHFKAALALDPHDKDINYFCAFSLFHLRRFQEAIQYYQRALAINPDDVSSVFGLSNCYREIGDRARATVYLRKFIELRKNKLNTATSLVYGQEGQYAMATDVVPAALRMHPHPVPVKFVESGSAWGLSFTDHAAAPSHATGPGACILDYDGDGKPDVFFVDSNGKPALLHNLGNGHFQDVTSGSGLDVALHGIGCAAGDYDNDGKADLAVTTPNRLLLFHNLGHGKFQEVSAAVGLKTAGVTLGVAFIDLDHDGYLDLVVPSSAGKVQTFHNLGTGKFSDISATTRIGQTQADWQGLVATDYDNDRDIDVVLARADGPAVIFSNNRDGSFTEVQPWQGDPVAHARGVLSLDFNHDGWMDLFFTRAQGSPVLLRATGDRRYVVHPLPPPNSSLVAGWGATAIDFDNDGFVDLAFIGETVDGVQHLKLYRNRGDGSFEDVSAQTGLDAVRLKNARALITADLDGDGAPDLIVTQAGGPALVLRNAGGNANHSLRLTLHGLKDNKTGIGTKVVLRADGLWQKTEVDGGSGYLGQNDTSVLFGIGPQITSDSVSMLWPTGVLQDEFPGTARQVAYTELDRKGGSCPILYSWNGRRFAFIDDIVGPGVVGEWVGPHQYDEPQPAECLRLPANAVAERNGAYEFRFTDQMEEVVYLDKAQLTVVDHPADVKVFGNDRWQPDGPAPAEHFWQVGRTYAPLSAVDEGGHDLLPDLAWQDGHYAPIYARSAFPGYVGAHTLTMNLGDLSHARTAQLLMNGWTDYYFPGTTWTAYHAGIKPTAPSLAVPDGRGGWKRVMTSIGAPAGLPRTMVVNLTPLLRKGVFPKGDYRVRISTNLAIYWDQVLVSVDAPRQPLRVTHLDPSAAVLHYLGYPRQISSAPESYDYTKIDPEVGFRRVAGNYTRYGDVLPLLTRKDDEQVIMSSGDEIQLRFAAKGLPSLPKGWTRTFFFCADGFTKGDEFLDAHPDGVNPLPYHGVRYPTPDSHPESVEHLRYRLHYNTRHIALQPRTEPGNGSAVAAPARGK